MFQRLAFAIATEIDPEILLVDESLNADDARFVQKAKAVILVSHDISIVKELCTRVIWLKKGQIIADGPTQPVLDRYWADLHGLG